MKKLALAVLVGTACLTAPSVYAQKNLVKGLTEALSSKATAAVSAQVERQVARATLGAQLEQQLASQITQYHPVFGYTLPAKPVLSYDLDLYTPFRNGSVGSVPLLQVKPILNKNQIQTAFEMYEKLDLPQTTQMIYLWSLAHPQEYLTSAAFLHMDSFADFLQDVGLNQLYKGYRTSVYDNKLENLPNLLLLEKLTSMYGKARSYAELYENITVYPKHITLNEYGFPVETKDAKLAKELDLYLMLSNPKEMGAYNNATTYTPLVLTKEEHEAADDLLALRMREEKMPQNPTERDLLGLAYNRLATHMVPYTDLKIVNHSRWNVDRDYKTYPNYKNTQLYRTIKGILNSTETIPDDRDMLHLIVLDAVMGGVDTNNLYEVDRALSAFDKLCNIPYNEHTVRHLTALQYNLRFIFRDILLFNEDHKLTAASPDWRKIIVAEKARLLLKRNTAEDLIRNSPLGRI